MSLHNIGASTPRSQIGNLYMIVITFNFMLPHISGAPFYGTNTLYETWLSRAIIVRYECYYLTLGCL
jgi:hypothetical protein